MGAVVEPALWRDPEGTVGHTSHQHREGGTWWRGGGVEEWRGGWWRGLTRCTRRADISNRPTGCFSCMRLADISDSCSPAKHVYHHMSYLGEAIAATTFSGDRRNSRLSSDNVASLS